MLNGLVGEDRDLSNDRTLRKDQGWGPVDLVGCPRTPSLVQDVRSGTLSSGCGVGRIPTILTLVDSRGSLGTAQ